MPNAAKALIIIASAAALAACHKAPAQNQAANQDISIDDNVAVSGVPDNAQIETLPPDESSATPSNQLQTGYDNPDVNDLGNSH
jgi:ABC-type uncharacterized transport system auxiliary subunit